ncbi:MAG: hypothetical protein FWE88_04900 [Phycisphaerae bacterium]|nr:hypothetical protein [Phycisphaerae bacterium]
MNRFRNRLLIVACGLLGLLTAPPAVLAQETEKTPTTAKAVAATTIPATTTAPAGAVAPVKIITQKEAKQLNLIVDENDFIYDTQEAYDLVMQARKCDNTSGNFDREKAVELYEKAIAAQPGAKINAELANRIGGMYSFNTPTDRDKGRQWWKRALELASPGQLLWAQIQMGLGDMDAILNMDFGNIELAEYKVWPDNDDERGQDRLMVERARLWENIQHIQTSAVRRKFDILRNQRAGKEEIVKFLQTMADKFTGDPAGDWALEKIAELQGNAEKKP